VVTPLWWRETADPDLSVTALHDGKTLAIRLSWHDAAANGRPVRPEEFEDMAGVQLFKGGAEPFLGMGAAGELVDLWLWRAGGPAKRLAESGDHPLDDYPFDSPVYGKVIKGKGVPDFLTARAAGNPNFRPDAKGSASHLGAKGFGSTTFRPKESQQITAKAEWAKGRWNVVLRRPLTVKPTDGVPLAAGEACSIAFALWFGEHGDRNGQKLVSIWHDLKVE
jgi:hypothetical protein